MYDTLAHLMRPTSLQNILGQKHLVSHDAILSKFVETKHPFSVIFYGPPGCGKTTLASALANDLQIPYRLFNASTGNKKQMDIIIEEAKMSDGLFVIIDEVHRLNKDKQDHLLPHIENGLLVIAGCTTANPFHSINPAIRSRCHILEVKPLDEVDIIEGLKKAANAPDGLNNAFKIDELVYKQIASLCNGDIRYAYNCLEICSILTSNNHITLDTVQRANIKANFQYDKDEDQYYDTLSGLQKSIRGSDPNGAMFYFAKLIEANDIESLERRLVTIAYEDIGLANPNACMRTVIALQAAKTIGFPEARIPIANAIIDLCLSPKSKSSEVAIDRAIQAVKQYPLKAPNYLRLTPVGLSDDEIYHYDRPELWSKIQYLPEQLKDAMFYEAQLTSKYEKALNLNYQELLKSGRTSNIKYLNQNYHKLKKK